MEYRSAIVDETRELVAWCDELTESEKDKIMDEHPEYNYSCLECGCDGYPCY